MYTQTYKILLIIIIETLSITYVANAQTGINTTTPDSNSALDIVSSSRGVLIPRLTNDQVSVLENRPPAKGMLIYNIEKECVQIFHGNTFECITIDSGTDKSKDTWVDDSANNQVKLGAQSNGDPRMANTYYVIKDNGKVDIGTEDPQENLDVREVNPSSPSANAGVALPQVSNLPSSGNRAGQVVYYTADNRYYYYNGTDWQCLNCTTSYGDVKQSFTTTDHQGWVLLDGRATSTLNTTQQARATAIGFSGNLPNATDRILKKKGNVGSTGGSNTTTLTQANLPNVDFTGTTNTAGNHRHSFEDGGGSSQNNSRGSDPFNLARGDASDQTGYAGDHSHTVTVSSGGSGTAIDIENTYLSVNTLTKLGL